MNVLDLPGRSTGPRSAIVAAELAAGTPDRAESPVGGVVDMWVHQFERERGAEP